MSPSKNASDTFRCKRHKMTIFGKKPNEEKWWLWSYNSCLFIEIPDLSRSDTWRFRTVPGEFGPLVGFTGLTYQPINSALRTLVTITSKNHMSEEATIRSIFTSGRDESNSSIHEEIRQSTAPQIKMSSSWAHPYIGWLGPTQCAYPSEGLYKRTICNARPNTRNDQLIQ